MQLTLTPYLKPLPSRIAHQDKILLIGSCFTEHMAARLAVHKFSIVQNPTGILFTPLKIAQCLERLVSGKHWEAGDLFFANDTWNSWQHHSRFSHPEQETALAEMNKALGEAAAFAKEANWLFLTLGSAWQYYLKEGDVAVANNHRAPAQQLEKRLLPIAEMKLRLQGAIETLRHQNPNLKVLLTVSPVRHLRDGLPENNRSKARLIEVVHSLAEAMPEVHYFAAYELLIDVLRDYRFYDVDFAHPNYLATSYVWEAFAETCLDPAAKPLMAQLKELDIARRHRPRFPNTAAHQAFLKEQMVRILALQTQNTWLDLEEEKAYFQS